MTKTANLNNLCGPRMTNCDMHFWMDGMVGTIGHMISEYLTLCLNHVFKYPEITMIVI
jgi:hypothetical protein